MTKVHVGGGTHLHFSCSQRPQNLNSSAESHNGSTSPGHHSNGHNGESAHPDGEVQHRSNKHHKWHRFRNNRACPGQSYIPTEFEQLANIVTHGIALVPSGYGMLLLICRSTSIPQALVAAVYGLALIALFGVSTSFHMACHLEANAKTRFFLHVCDRATIFIFIGCSYTPWLLLKDSSIYFPSVLVILWLFIAAAIQYQRLYHEKNKCFETFLYIFLGSVPGLITVPFMEDPAGIDRLAIGGLVYIVGVAFFKSDGIIPCAHAIWHCFVICGCLWHFMAVIDHLYPGEPILS